MISSLTLAAPLARLGLNQGKHILGASFKLILSCNIHTTPSCNVYNPTQGIPTGVPKWFAKNEKVYPPQQPGEERRSAWICHAKENVKYSPLKLWYIACLIRGLSVDEALKQLSFVNAKGAQFVIDTLKEAQELAVKEHNVEYKSNLWVAESLATKGTWVRGYRRHARARFYVIHYRYSHYLVRLEEGKPPKHYYPPEPTAEEKLKAYFEKFRRRKIISSL
ncbi:54S ribosomal protein L22, mitochondrial [Chamberlinius hualienensis]